MKSLAPVFLLATAFALAVQCASMPVLKTERDAVTLSWFTLPLGLAGLFAAAYTWARDRQRQRDNAVDPDLVIDGGSDEVAGTVLGSLFAGVAATWLLYTRVWPHL